jgi:hypothetical protein
LAGKNGFVNQAAGQVDLPHEGRQQVRTHLFVAATLYADAGSAPVTIRNMSPSGALVEGTVLPDVGERIDLKRGQLRAAGWIAWRVERKAGVRLEARVHVPDWMTRQVNTGQEQVDALMSMVRNHGPAAPAAAGRATGQLSMEAELLQLRLELGELEAALLKDVVVIATHPEIQTLDISAQRIDRVLKALRARG